MVGIWLHSTLEMVFMANRFWVRGTCFFFRKEYMTNIEINIFKIKKFINFKKFSSLIDIEINIY